MIPIIHMLAKDNQVGARDRLKSIHPCNRASAGGQLEQPSDVNNSTRIGVSGSVWMVAICPSSALIVEAKTIAIRTEVVFISLNSC